MQRGRAGRPGGHRSIRREAQAGLAELIHRQPDAIAPDGSEIYYRELGAKRASLVEVVLPPGGVSRPVRHRTVEEIWYFLSGAGEVWLDGVTRAVEPGATVVISTGVSFQFRTVGEAPLRFLCFTSPPWPGDGEAELMAETGLGEPTV